MNEGRVFVVLKCAELEAGKDGHLLEDASCRPDIAHRCLLVLLDSPLNRAGRLKVFVHTRHNILIDVSSQARLPRTFRRFSGLFAQLLRKMKIKASGKTLLNIVKNPVERYLPEGTTKIGLSSEGERVRLGSYTRTAEGTVCFFIGSMAHGEDSFEAEKMISIGEGALTASTVCGRICYSYEEKFGL